MSQTFRLKKEHILLLKSSRFDWWDDECGGIVEDRRRPYGNSDHIRDIAEILGIKQKLDVGKSEAENELIYDEEQEQELLQLHRETEMALKIILTTKSFKPGLYQADRDDENWKWVRK